MPQIIVIADPRAEQGESEVMLRERVSVTHLESQHFATQLVERIGWAVRDAAQVEREPGESPAARGLTREPAEWQAAGPVRA